MASVALSTVSARVSLQPGSHIHVQNLGARDATLTCRGVSYLCTTTDRDGGVLIPARGAEVVGITAAGSTTVEVTVHDLGGVADGGGY